MARIQQKTTKDGRRRFYVTIRLKGIPTLSGAFERLTDARKWAADKESEIRRGRYFDDSASVRHTLEETIDRYLRDVMPRKAASNAPTEGQRLAWWRRQIGRYTLKGVTPALLTEHRDRLRGEGKSEATVKRYLRNLGHVLTMAVEWHWLKESPMRLVRMPREPRGRVRFLEKGELERLLKACRESPSPLLYPAVILSLATGMRRGEVRGLTWDRVRLEDGVILLEVTKNGERRGVPLSGHALEVVREHARVRRLDSKYVFPSGEGGKGYDFRRPFTKALLRAGIADFHWHDMRHTCASYMVMSGANLATVAELLGHKTLAMTKRYSHLSQEHLKGEVDRMGEKMFG